MASWKSNVKWVVAYPAMVLLMLALSIVKELLLGLAAFLVSRKTPTVVRTPSDRFRGIERLGYAFEPNYVKLPIGGGKTLPRLHYVDEGPREAKETVLCLHGKPSWSFLYRLIVPVLVKAGHRVIAPDFIGFGKSDKFTDKDMYTQEMHTMTLRLLLDHLDVRNVTLVCQDWGGLVGLSVVKDMPDVFSRLVIMNTGLPCEVEYSRSAISFLMWRYFARLLDTYMPIYDTFKYALIKPSNAILEAYAAPFPSSVYKAGAAKWPQLVPINSHSIVASDMLDTRKFLVAKWKRPALIMFSDKDPITRHQDKMFLNLMPHATTMTVTGAGHFLQEDKGEELATHIANFIDGKL